MRTNGWPAYRGLINYAEPKPYHFAEPEERLYITRDPLQEEHGMQA